MKICFVSTVPVTLNAFVLPTVKYLYENTDWDISFICDNDPEFAKNLPSYIHYYPIPMERGISVGGIKAMFKMKQLFKKEKFDMVQYSTPNASLYASLASFFTRIPVRLYCQWGMAYVGFEGAKRKIFKAEEKLVCSLSTWIEPDSKSNLRFAHSERLYPEKKGSVIWNGSACGIDIKKFDINKKDEYRKKIRSDLDIPDNTFVYIFVGRITGDKGINELLASFEKISSEKDNVRLLMVGEPEKTETLDAGLYERSRNNGKIIYTGTTNVVEQYLSASDCYLLPSYREGFGMGVIEAEAMGLPVIVSDIPGPTDAMKCNTTGFVVKKKDVDSLTAAMKKMLSDEEIRNVMSKEAYKFAVSNFEQQRLFECILEDRKRLLGE